MPNPWQEFQNIGYRIEDLGRPAVFLMPTYKLDWPYMERHTVRDDLHAFLLAYFGSFTTTITPFFGFYKKGSGVMIHDQCYQYEVSFVGKDRIGLLISKLAVIARRIEEECIYFKAGEDACLIYPS